jgi:hypothetical protein
VTGSSKHSSLLSLVINLSEKSFIVQTPEVEKENIRGKWLKVKSNQAKYGTKLITIINKFCSTVSRIRVEGACRDKQSSFLRHGIFSNRKMFYSTGPRSNKQNILREWVTLSNKYSSLLWIVINYKCKIFL